MLQDPQPLSPTFIHSLLHSFTPSSSTSTDLSLGAQLRAWLSPPVRALGWGTPEAAEELRGPITTVPPAGAGLGVDGCRGTGSARVGRRGGPALLIRGPGPCCSRALPPPARRGDTEAQARGPLRRGPCSRRCPRLALAGRHCPARGSTVPRGAGGLGTGPGPGCRAGQRRSSCQTWAGREREGRGCAVLTGLGPAPTSLCPLGSLPARGSPRGHLPPGAVRPLPPLGTGGRGELSLRGAGGGRRADFEALRRVTQTSLSASGPTTRGWQHQLGGIGGTLQGATTREARGHSSAPVRGTPRPEELREDRVGW